MIMEYILIVLVSSYPLFAQEHLHICNAYLPSDIAKALSEQPYLVQKAIETFYTRDAMQLRVNMISCVSSDKT